MHGEGLSSGDGDGDKEGRRDVLGVSGSGVRFLVSFRESPNDSDTDEDEDKDGEREWRSGAVIAMLPNVQ